MTRIIDAAMDARKRQPAVHQTENGMPDPVAQLKVFLIDESPSLRERVIEKITSTGRIAVAGFADNEQTAIEKLQDIHCDAILFQLPGRHGAWSQILRLLRLQGSYRPYVIVFSDYANPLHARDKRQDLDYLRDLLEGLSPAQGRH
jgi:chemotaxis response regulator CheB